MTKAIRFHQTGGPEVLKLDDVDVGDPKDNQILVRHTAIGLNYIDTYHRSGLYPLPLPSMIGMEAAGIVLATGPNVNDIKSGDRIAYACPPPGSYCEERLIDSDKVVIIPPGVTDDAAAAMMLKGLTAQYLIRQIYRVASGDTILIHAAAGGVGLRAAASGGRRTDWSLSLSRMTSRSWCALLSVGPSSFSRDHSRAW